ncbi:hypothetical protein DB346_01875 [Verrucomicrobia bacterium LW23]|nr:hypothetical protein DB346_01875 [Verrucomicrobia bacterium LW23]
MTAYATLLVPPALAASDMPWWITVPVTILMVASWLFSSWQEYQAKQREAEEAEQLRRERERNPPAPPAHGGQGATDSPWQPVVVNRDLADALGRKDEGDVVHLPAPPPRRRIEPSPHLPPPPQRRYVSTPPPTPPARPPITPFPQAEEAPALPLQPTGSEPSLILTQLDRLRAQNAAAAAPPPMMAASAGRGASTAHGTPSLQTAGARATGAGLAALLRDKNAARQAFLLKEILGTPRGLSSEL